MLKTEEFEPEAPGELALVFIGAPAPTTTV
jgi:hypothetical protein